MKLSLILMFLILLTTACPAYVHVNPNNVSDPFTLKKGEARQIGTFNIKMLSVGHTFGTKGPAAFSKLEISENGKVSKPTIYLAGEIPLGDKYLKLLAVDEKADPKLSDPFAATSCTLVVSNEPGEKSASEARTATVSAPTDFCFKNGGLKNEMMITFSLEGNKVSDGEFGVTGYDDSTSGETYHFNGTKAGNSLTVRFTGTVPEEFGKIKKLVWTLGKNNLKVQMYGKNHNTNKWGVYTATYEKCSD